MNFTEIGTGEFYFEESDIDYIQTTKQDFILNEYKAEKKHNNLKGGYKHFIY